MVFLIVFQLQTISIVDLNVALKESASYEDICKKVKEASMTYLSGILDYVDDEVVSSDFIGDSHASIFDARQGIQVNSHFFKVICFYDNEWGYTSQIFRLIKYRIRLTNKFIRCRWKHFPFWYLYIFTCGKNFLIRTVTILLSVRDIYIRHYDYEPYVK